ncbi:MAG: DUF2252 domain-containing protein [Hyphomicrobiales bacterium]|nr:DUF2252 domain-containing protein [Hyphomicrobiales bacterium]
MTSPTLAERYQRGVQLREQTPLMLHGDLAGSSTRDPVAILAASDRTRLPELLPVRYALMLENPFAFLRGAAAVMAVDLAEQPHAAIPVQSCGDCHLMNFGAFATPEQNILFDINDFDETLAGVDFTADIKRLTASVAVAALAAGFSKKRARTMAAETVRAYRTRIRALAPRSPLEIWHSRIDLAREIDRIDDRPLRRQLRAILAKTSKRTEQDDNFPHLVKGKVPRIADRPPLIYHFTGRDDRRHHVDAERMFAAYRRRLPPERLCLVERYTLRDIAFKVVGVGSVGTFCAIGLFTSVDGAPLLLQIKEARASVLERLASRYKGHPGRRVVEGQRIMQAASDIFLGWTEDEESSRHFYVRQLKNRRLGSVSELVEERALASYARLCGRSLARAHARSGDPAVLAGYMGKKQRFDDALASFAMLYAERTQSDYDRVLQARGAAAKSGRDRRPAKVEVRRS